MVHIRHIFLIHSSVNGYAGCFHTLAIANNVPMNIGMHVSFQISVSSLALFFWVGGDIFLGVELLSHMIVLLLDL